MYFRPQLFTTHMYTNVPTKELGPKLDAIHDTSSMESGPDTSGVSFDSKIKKLGEFHPINAPLINDKISTETRDYFQILTKKPHLLKNDPQYCVFLLDFATCLTCGFATSLRLVPASVLMIDFLSTKNPSQIPFICTDESQKQLRTQI